MTGLSCRELVSPRERPRGYLLKPEPIFQERVWGQEDLSFLYPSRFPKPPRVGEVWLTGDENRIGEGPWAEVSLGEVAKTHAPMLLGRLAAPIDSPNPPFFPLLVKFLFTSDKLSVQVHPPDSYAQEREGRAGKTEMWHVLRAGPQARLAIGFREDLPSNLRSDRGVLRAAVQNGAIEQMLRWMPAQAGDTFFVPAGTVHVIGPGLVLCEIQQNSDITYRLYDYNRPGTDGRPRLLHVEKALDVLDWHSGGGLTIPLDCGGEPGLRSWLAACRYFATEKMTLHSPYLHGLQERMEVWVCLEGEATFRTGETACSCRGGEVVVIPAAVASVEIAPAVPSVFLRTFPPDLEKDVKEPLRQNGVSEERLRGFCFSGEPSVRGEKR